MSALSERRSVLDWLGVLIMGAFLLSVFATAIYGFMCVFTPTVNYQEANLWAGMVCALLAALAALYLVIELSGWGRVRPLVLAILCAVAGYFAALSGLPAIFTQGQGIFGTVDFKIVGTELSWGRYCAISLTAANADFATMRLCADGLVPAPRAGDRLRVTAFISDWGLTVEGLQVLPNAL